jgi:hypothetical protein
MPAELQITLLGSPGVALDGRPVTGFVSTKAQALVYYLAATGRSHTRRPPVERRPRRHGQEEPAGCPL